MQQTAFKSYRTQIFLNNNKKKKRINAHKLAYIDIKWRFSQCKMLYDLEVHLNVP